MDLRQKSIAPQHREEKDWQRFVIHDVEDRVELTPARTAIVAAMLLGLRPGRNLESRTSSKIMGEILSSCLPATHEVTWPSIVSAMTICRQALPPS